MKLDAPKNVNYCATVVRIDKILPHANADKLAKAIIFGNSVIVGKDVQVGDVGIFFPLECKLSPEFLKYNNLFREKTWNVDQTKAGFFEENGRIRAVKLRGEKSEGFFVGLESTGMAFDNKHLIDLNVGDEFDTINGKVICEKYVIPVKGNGGVAKVRGPKAVPRLSRLVEGQFKLHIDTAQLKKNMDKINPEDMISITSKWHGTSWVAGRLLQKKRFGWFKTLLAKMLGSTEYEYEYGMIYSSRKVIKNAYFEDQKNNPNHFYGYDLWKDISDKVADVVPEGITLYGEAVGYTKEGAMIQKGYHYGAKPGTYDLYVYRITFTNPNGDSFEFTWGQIKDFCAKYGLNAVKEYFYGKAKDYHGFDIYTYTVDQWREGFLEKLNADKNFGMGDSMCKWNNNEVPSEGVVLKKDNLFEDQVFKLKNFAFLAHETAELDKGETNIEDNQSADAE